MGRGVTKGTISQTGTSIRRASRIGRESQTSSQAEEESEMYQKELNDLQAHLQQDIAQVTASYDPQTVKLETVKVRPRKSDITVEKIALIWWPK